MKHLYRSIKIFSFLILLIVLSAKNGIAQNGGEPALTDQLLDILRSEGNYENSDLSVFDVAGYDRVYRIDTPLGKFKSYNINIPLFAGEVPQKDEFLINRKYKFRIGGFKRGNLFSPDKIGAIFAENHVDYSDGPGNDIFESLMICKKYGLRHYFYAPDFYDLISSSGWRVGESKMDILEKKKLSVITMPSTMKSIVTANHELDLPFLETDKEKYIKTLRKELRYMKTRLNELSDLFKEEGGLFPSDYKNNPDLMWLLFAGGDLTPIDFFWNAAKDDFEAVNNEFKDRFGFGLPLILHPSTPLEKAHRIIFWNWAREKFTNIMKLRADIFREEISGKGILASNVHFDTQVDYKIYGSAFDFPGFGIRPQMTDDKLAWHYLMGYGTRLAADLSRKLPMISVRSNLAAAGSRIIPTQKTIEYWYSQAVQNGSVGFYLWEQDFPSYKGAYSGPNVGNPDSSSLPRERWNSHLKMAKVLSSENIFIPPKSETAVLTSIDANSLGNYGWKKVFSSYIELSKAKIWINFISDHSIKSGIDSLSEYKVVYIPFMDFADRDVALKIQEYVEKGGIIISGDPSIFSYDLQGESIMEFRKTLFGIDKTDRRSKESDIIMDDDFENIVVKSYSGEMFNLTIDADAKVIGKYEDGKTAVTIKNYGKGIAIFWGAPIFDIYLYAKKPEFKENSERYEFLNRIAQIYGTEDLSWIWKININNISKEKRIGNEEVTKPLESIKFRRYLK